MDINGINGNGFAGNGSSGGNGLSVSSPAGAIHPGARVRVRTLIVDDAPAVRAGVRLLLSQDTEVEVVGEAGGGPEALAFVRRERPDLVLLDAQMPGMGGLEVAARLAREGLPAVVFITSCDREALDALRAQGLDYLLKPFEDDRFFDAVRRAKVRIRLARTLDQGERVLAAYRAFSGGAELQPEPPAAPPLSFGEGGALRGPAPEGAQGYVTRLAIRDIGRVVLVNVDEIDWIEAADYYVQIHVGSKAYLHRETMQKLEAELDPGRFIRIHRSAIVNQTRIRELRHQGRRDMLVVLDGGAELRVARSHREKLQRIR
ncbi:MAG TPA: LytTR family DNA-binding domain-containing protein [Myxococcales bacterium]|jgi:two-component system LytT family response regulator|nr:LytTR family DNA-binding domain-containing protein [Myxococcales bacterium]